MRRKVIWDSRGGYAPSGWDSTLIVGPRVLPTDDGGTWILFTGAWDDSGEWDDTEMWTDS